MLQKKKLTCQPTTLQCLSVDGEKQSSLSSHLYSSGSNSSTSSISSTSLETIVSDMTQEDSLIGKVQVLQREAVLIKEAINEGKVDAETVCVTLEKMLQEHMYLTTTVATVTTSLEAVNNRSKGRVARHIATSYTSLGAQLHILSENLSDLERTLHAAHHLPTSITMATTTTSGSSDEINDEVKLSPCLPDMYLTPSRPIYYSVSPVTSELFHSPPGSSKSLSPPKSTSSPGYHSSPESPSPPESPNSPDYHGSPSPPSSYSSLSELDPFTPDTALPPPSHLSELTIPSPLHLTSPPLLSPCADSGIASSSGHSSHQHHHHTAPSSQPTLSPTPPPLSSTHSSTHNTPSPKHLTITMEDIDAMKNELAKLREEIRSTSNWSPLLNDDLPHVSSSPSYACKETGLTGITGFLHSSSSSSTVSNHGSLDSIPFHRHPDSIPDHSQSVSIPHYRSTESKLAVPRPYLSVSRPHSHTASLTHQLTTPHRPHSICRDQQNGIGTKYISNSIHRDQQNGIGTASMSHVRTNSRAVQTTPTTLNNSFGTKTSNIQNEFSHGLYSSPSFISDHLSSSQLPTNFTPHLLVHTIHHSPHPTTTHLPTHTTIHLPQGTAHLPTHTSHTTPSRPTHLIRHARALSSYTDHHY